MSNNYLYQQHLHLHQQNQNAAVAAAMAAAGQMGGAVTPQILQRGIPGGSMVQATPGMAVPGTGSSALVPQQRFVGGLNYVMASPHPMYQAVSTVPGPRGGRGLLANSNTGIFTKQPQQTLYSSMIFPQHGRQSRIVHDMVSLQQESFRRISGIGPDVFQQIQAVEQVYKILDKATNF